MTAAGTVAPAKVLDARRRRRRACRPSPPRAGSAPSSRRSTCGRSVKEQVESLGATFLEIELPEEDAETAGGYAKELSEEAHRREQELRGASTWPTPTSSSPPR